MSLSICHKHECAHTGVCEACNLQDRLTEATNDLLSTRSELIDCERECLRLEEELNHALGRIEKLEPL
jgi:predicted nuclease with TOPRIM domain